MNSFGNFNNNNNFPSLDSFTQDNGFSNQGMIEQNYNFGSATLDNGSRDATSIAVRKVYLGKTRPQAQQHRRSYDVLLNGNDERTLENSIDRHGVNAFNPGNLGELFADGLSFIKHSGTPEAPVSIDNGWDRDRFRFTLVVDVYRNGRFVRTEFVSGYTNHAGVTNAGLISSVTVDSNMVFTINHITEATARNVNGQGQPVPMITRSNAVVHNKEFKGMGMPGNDLYLTRPMDILRTVDKVGIYKGMEVADSLGSSMGKNYQDLDSMLTNMPKLSADTNLLLPTFAARTIKGLFEHSLNTFDPMNMDGQGSGAMAAANIADTPFNHSGFVMVMNRRVANGVTTSAMFTFGDLLMMDSSIDDRTEVFGRTYETGRISIPDGRSVACIGDAETIATHATSIVHTTLALMSIAGVATLAYSATNMETGLPEITLQACDGLDTDGMLMQRLENLKTRLKIECLNMVGAGNVPFEVEVFADAFNDVFIKLMWNDVYRDYVIPAYASSSLAPVVTNDISHLVGVAETIGSVVETMKHMIAPGSTNNNTLDISVQGNGNSRFAGLAGDF